MAVTIQTLALATAGVAALFGASYAYRRAAHSVSSRSSDEPLPQSLRDTGLYSAWETKTVASANLAYTPQYPLWSDGARKQRWIYLPPGTAIDGSDPDAWQFPVGTKLWKEFAFGRRTETRYMERTTTGWRYASYVWSGDETEAVLAPKAGTRTEVVVGAGAHHAIPSEGECRACHANGPTPVLGFAALQLSPDRDVNAPHRERAQADAVDLVVLVASGLVRGYPAELVAPRIDARDPVERAALGYLHGNCGGCHRADGPLASVGLVLAQPVRGGGRALATTLDERSHFEVPDATVRIAPGDPDHSVVMARVRSRVPATQMPALGTQLVDDDAVALLTRWIAQLEPAPEGDAR